MTLCCCWASLCSEHSNADKMSRYTHARRNSKVTLCSLHFFKVRFHCLHLARGDTGHMGSESANPEKNLLGANDCHKNYRLREELSVPWCATRDWADKFLNFHSAQCHCVTTGAPNHYNMINATQGNSERSQNTLITRSENTQNSLREHSPHLRGVHLFAGRHFYLIKIT